LLALGHFGEAWGEAEQLLATALTQRDTDLYWDAAQAAWRAGRFREAGRWIETYLDFHPDSPEQWEALADIRTQLGEHAEAERARTNAAQAKRNFILALHMQARRAAVAGVRDEAVNQLRTIVLLDPSYLPARQDLERLQRGQSLKF
jgi:tetratricopeptide (TPR) repeat protein